MYSYHADELKLFPWREEFRTYSLAFFWKDLLAGLEVALLTIPQALAYALVAGLPTSCGLYAAIFSSLMASFLGSSRYLIVGPVNALAILMQAGTADIIFTYYREAAPAEKELLAIQIMTQIALLSGIFQVVASLFKLGRFTQFVSHSVVIGYLAGSAAAIIVNQFFVFMGIPSLEGVNSLFDKIYYLIFNIESFNGPTLLMGCFSLILLVVLRKMGQRIPYAAMMLVGAALVSFLISKTPYEMFTHSIDLVGSTADAYSVVPLFSWPSFNLSMMNHLLSTAFAITLLSIIETACSAKSLAAASGLGISINQEILSVGAANLISSCTGSMPVSVSNSRSQFNWHSGARTRFAGIFCALFVASIIGYFGSLVNAIPLPALAALLLVIGFGIVNPKQLLLCLKSTGSDAFVLLSTFAACIFFNLDTAFYIGVILSISLYLQKAAMPQLVEFAIDDEGDLRSLDRSEIYLRRPIRIIKVEGELFFGSADIFYTTLKSLAEDDESTRVILLQLKNARDIDATTCLSLLQLFEYLEKAKRHLVLSGMTHEMWDVMSNSGLISKIGKQNLFVFDEHAPHLYMQRAIARAKQLAFEDPLKPILQDNSTQAQTYLI